MHNIMCESERMEVKGESLQKRHRHTAHEPATVCTKHQSLHSCNQ